MPRKTSKKSSYTQAEKLAYYKKKAAQSYGGRGAYTRRPAPKTAAIGQSIGSSLGSLTQFIPGVGPAISPVASMLAGKLGSYLGNKLGSYAGWGSYSITKNSLLVPEGNSPAAMHSDGRVTRVCHREYICDIISSVTPGAFKLQSFQVNPSDPIVFPWLSELGACFQKYSLKGAVFEFKTGSADALNSTNTALGEVIMSSNYNCADANFTSRMQMENTQYCSSAKPSESFVHVIECDPQLQAQENLYVNSERGISIPAGMTVNELNWVNMQIATVGVQGASVNLGSLYITYDFEFIQPVELSTFRTNQGDWFVGSTYSNAQPFNAVIANEDNSIGGTVTPGAAYYFPPTLQEGLFKYEIIAQGSGAVAWSMPAFVYTNCAVNNAMNGASLISGPAAGVSTTIVVIAGIVKVTGQGAYVNFAPSPWALPTTPIQIQFMIDRIDQSFEV